MSDWKITVNGVIKDFEDDFNFCVETMAGAGHSPVGNRSLPYALQDGAVMTGQKMETRAFTLLGAFHGFTTLTAFHDNRANLIKALSSRVGRVNEAPTPVIITYTGATVDKQIECYYEGGLELAAFHPITKSIVETAVPIRFVAYDPAWKATSDTEVTLATSSSPTLDSICSFKDGVLDEMDNAGGYGLTSDVYTLVRGGENREYLYVGGDFTMAGSQGLLRVAQIKNNVHGWLNLGYGLDDVVHALAVAANGDVYAGGEFLNSDVTSVVRIGIYNGTSWATVGSGADANVTALAIALNGDLYAGGHFSNIGGSAISYLAKWDGTAWSAVGTGVDNVVTALGFNNAGELYIGGMFTTAGGTTVNGITMWDGTTFHAMGTGLDGTVGVLGNKVYSLAIAENGDVYIGGYFATVSGVSGTQSIARWDRANWYELDGGINKISASVYGNVYSLNMMETGNLIVGGNINGVGNEELAVEHNALWNNGWKRFPIEFDNTIYAVNEIDNTVYYGGLFSGATKTTGVTTITYDGTEIAYPVITIKRSGGTYANIQSFHNGDTGAVLRMDYDLMDGETLTIDLRPNSRGITSSVYGSSWQAILDNSDFASFFLQPDNSAGSSSITIAAYVYTDATITAKLTYRAAYRSID